LIVRPIPKALSQASASALGITDSTDACAAAFVFYDRVLALRTSTTRLLPVILGRVIAHELTHLLLPEEDHSELGLMRGQWTADDLRTTSLAFLGLSRRSVELMETSAHGECSRRAGSGWQSDD
jgi:hypothetical protein